jgi:AraC-like DNA-binding protein
MAPYTNLRCEDPLTEHPLAADATEERLRLQIEAYHSSALIYAAARLGLPETVTSREWTARQLADELGLSSPHLFRFLRVLSTIGICEERPNHSFALTPAAMRSGPVRLRGCAKRS